MNPKKIAFVIHGFPMGGAEKFLINLVNHFYKIGYAPLVISLSEEKALLNELDERIKVAFILKKSRFDIFVSKRIKSKIIAEKINTVFCINTYSFFLTKLAFIFDKRTKFYLSPHTTIPISKKSYWQNIFYFRLLSNRDTVIYLCNAQKEYLEQKYFFHSKLQTVIYNGVDTNYFDSKKIDTNSIDLLKAQFSFSENAQIIIQVARLQEEKCHLDSIDALYYLHNEFKTLAHLLVVGSGEKEYTESLQKHVQEKKLDSYVHFAGNQKDVRKFYCIADIFTLTSISETFSIAALEAMAFGLPCSLTNVGGAKEMMIEGVTGMLSKPNDIKSIATTWHQLLNSNIKGDFIRNYVIEHFSLDKMLQQYVQLVGES
jgi:glycosyltransferase involved in cell wall biosynthesis